MAGAGDRESWGQWSIIVEFIGAVFRFLYHTLHNWNGRLSAGRGSLSYLGTDFWRERQ